MSMIGNLLAIPQSELDALYDDPETISACLYETHEADTVDVDKAWHAIHFTLTGDSYGGDGPISQPILGGTPIGDEDVGYGPARGLSAPEVQKVAAALAAISEASFRAKFDPAALEAADIYPQIWDEGDEALDYIAEYFLVMKQFYEQAAEKGLAAVLFIN